MEIYLDVLFVVNTYISLILLSLVETVTHFNIKRINLTVASLLGGASSLLILISTKKLFFTLLAYFLKMIVFLSIGLIAFNGAQVKKKIIYSCYFIGLNILLGGAVELLSEQFGTSTFFIYNGTVYFDISVYMLMAITAVVYIIISMIERIARYRLGRAKSYSVKVRCNGNEYIFDGLADTGNSAHDLFTGKPVIVCKGVSFYDGKNEFVRPIPYTTIAGEGMLYAVKPESVTVIDENRVSKNADVYVAGIDDGSKPVAIFNPSILR